MIPFTVSDIIIYPIKSLGSIKLTKAVVQKEGFENDRRWLLIDDHNKFVTQRTHTALAHFRCTLSSENLIVRFLNESIRIPLKRTKPAYKKEIPAIIWDHTVKSEEIDSKVSEWFSDQIGENVRLVKKEKNEMRWKSLIKSPGKTPLSYADAYPYLIIGKESLTYLNSLLSNPVTMDRFRANLIVQTNKPHEEDLWHNLHFPKAKMNVIKTCARCQVVNIDPTTLTKSKEPLKTLSQYRKKYNKIYFGINAIAMKTGAIAVGDQFTIG